MSEAFSREIMLVGEAAFERLQNAAVAVVGLGGVGGYAVEALVRAGIGSITLIDGDTISESNINRQLIALYSTVGMPKCEAAARRINDINPNCTIRTMNEFLTADTLADALAGASYVVDAIDMITVKIAIAAYCAGNSIPLISAMGTGNKLNAQMFRIADLFETQGDPIAKVMRRELKKRGINTLKVVYSEENTEGRSVINVNGARKPGSISYAPAVAGLLLANAVLRDIIG